MPYLLSEFQRKYPRVRVILDEGNSEDMARSVLEMKNELALISEISLDRKIKSTFFAAAEFVLVASSENRFSKRKSISLKELNDEPLILREKGSGLRAAILRKFHEYGIWPSTIIEASSLDFIKEYVKQNKGVSFTIEPDIQEELEKGILKIIPIDEGNIILFTDMIYHNEKSLSPPAQVFVKMLEELRDPIRKKFKALSVSQTAPTPH